MTESVTAPPASIGGEIASILRLALPLAGAQIAIVAMSATDAAFLGRLGPTALAGGGLAASIHATVQIVAAGVLTVLAPLLAEARARMDHVRVASITRNGLVVALALGVLGVVLVRHAGWMLDVAGEPSDVTQIAEPFLRAVAWSTPFALVSTVFRHVLTAAGRPQVVTVTTFAGAIANAFLDDALMRGTLGIPAMGASGVGYATTIVNGLVCAGLAVAAARIVSPRALLARRADRQVVQEIARLGLPAAAMIGAEVAVFQLAGVAVGRYGASWLAVHQIGLTIAWLSFVIPLGISQAAAVRVAQVRALEGRQKSRRPGLLAIGLAATIMAAFGGVLWFAPEPFVRLFVRADDTALVIHRAGAVLAVAAWFQIFDGVQVVAAGALRGLQDTRVPALIGAVSYCLVAPCVAWISAGPFGLGVVGIWIGLAAGLAVAAVALSLRFLAITARSLPGDVASRTGRHVNDE